MVEVNSFTTEKFNIIRTMLGEAGLRGEWRNVSEHAQRVAKVARVLGELAGLEEERLNKLELGGWGHEIGKREEIEGRKSGKFSDRVEAEEAVSARWTETFPEIMPLARATKQAAMVEYNEGKFAGEENFLARIVFLADDMVSGDRIVSVEQRTQEWPYEALRTERKTEYGNRTQQEIEITFGREVEEEIKARGKLNPEANLVELLKNRLGIN